MIELTNISKYYQMGDETVHALQDVSLKIDDGEYIAIIGPSGSGKSTLMNILGCLDIPSAGSYNLNGTLVSKMRESQLATVRNKNVGLVFQNFNLLGKATAIRNVELPARYGGIGPAERHKRALAAMTSVGLEHRLHHKPTELSGGQQQRVAIARALVNRPNILLADEPTGALDSKTGKEILDLFEQLQRENGITVIVVTHDPNVARRAHRVVTIRDGRIESDISRKPGKDGADVLVTHQMSVIPDRVEAAPVAYQDTVAEEIAADKAKKKQARFEGPIPFKRLALMGVIGVVLAIIANIILSQLAISLFSLRAPMLQIQQVALFTVIGTALAVLVFAAINRFARRPIWLFRIIAAVALVLSIVPDIGLATGLFNPFTFLGGGQRNGAAADAQGATAADSTTAAGGNRGGGFPGGAVRGAGGGGVGAALGIGARAAGTGAGSGFRNQSPYAVPGALIVLHIVAYGIVVGALTRQPKQKKPKAGKGIGMA